MNPIASVPKSSSTKNKFDKKSHTSNQLRKDLPFNNGKGSDLPIFSHKNELVESVRKHQTTIVIGETGSGKSTQLPKFLAEAFTSVKCASDKEKGADKRGNCIVCTQPRRVAAITVAQRVAAELDATCGQEVGYAVRFDDCTSNKTRIKFVTDGVLLRECMSDADMTNYSVIILDEAHERSLNTDILMGIVRDLQDKNPQLRVVIMSATLQVGVFMDFFRDTNLVSIAGRQFPVETFYTSEPEADYLDGALRTCLHIHASQPPGGVLVFLPGQEDIEHLIEMLEESLPAVQMSRDVDIEGSDISKAKHKGLVSVNNKTSLRQPHKGDAPNAPVEVIASFHDFELRPLYASMAPEQQLEAFAPCADPSIRKFVISTNIAETSVTINDIKYVVDTGYCKSKMNDSATGMDMLKVIPVSKQQADQRRGRAGRTGPGQCYRVFPLHVFESLPDETIPEIQRVNISQVFLQLKTIGIQSPHLFPYVSKPSKDSMRKAMEELFLLGALDGPSAELTPLGRKMSLLPLEPMFANLLLQSARCGDGEFIGISQQTPIYGCVHEMLTTVSMLSTDGVFVQPTREHEKELARKKHRNLSVKAGDLPTLLHIYNSWIQSNQSKDWATQNFLSQRVLLQAHNIRLQLLGILSNIFFNTPLSKDNKEANAKKSMFPSCLPQLEPYLRCLATGLCLNVAQRVADGTAQGTGVSSKSPQSGSQRYVAIDRSAAPYVTLRGRQPVYIHPSSVMFAATHSYAPTSADGKRPAAAASQTKKNRLPPYVVYSDLLITTKSYMRGVTGVQGEWLLGTEGAASVAFRRLLTPAAHTSTAQSTTSQEPNNKKRKFQNISASDDTNSSDKANKSTRSLTPQALAAAQGRTFIGTAVTKKYVSMSKLKLMASKGNKIEKSNA